MLIAGQREKESNSVSVRRHGEGDLGSFQINEITERILSEVEGKK
jgi:threonyl-tRNA synthetase